MLLFDTGTRSNSDFLQPDMDWFNPHLYHKRFTKRYTCACLEIITKTYGRGVYGEGICTLRTVRNWVKKFENSDFDVADCPRSGRPRRTDLTAPLQELLEEHPFMSARAMAKEFGVDKTTILRVLKN